MYCQTLASLPVPSFPSLAVTFTLLQATKSWARDWGTRLVKHCMNIYKVIMQGICISHKITSVDEQNEIKA